MNLNEFLGLILEGNGGDIPAAIREDEAGAGNDIIRPGGKDWLPLKDWHPDTVVSITPSGTVRLILLRARRPGRGALTRLLAALGSRAVEILCPTRELAATLSRRGWRSICRMHEIAWRQAPKKKAKVA